METLLTVLQVIACIVLVTSVLLQPSKGGAAFSASPQGVFGSSGGTNFLFKVTMAMAAFLMVSSIILSRDKIQEAKRSFIDTGIPAPGTPTPLVPPPGTSPGGAAPVAPAPNAAAPAAPNGGAPVGSP